MISKRISKKSWEFRPGSPNRPEPRLACQETQRGRRQTSLVWIPFLALLMVVFAAGCAPASSALVVMPVTGAPDTPPAAAAGASAPLEVREFPLVEQSKDNPTHLAFQQRVPEAVATQRAGFGLFRASDGLAEHNRALEPFGFRLQASSAAPFSGYNLYHGGALVQGGIARLWPVSLSQPADRAADFALPFVTVTGEKLVASASGVQPWPGQGQTGRAVAFVETSEAQLGLNAGRPTREHPTLDFEDLQLPDRYDEIFGARMLDDQPLYFFTRGGLTQVHYGDQDLPYQYDQIVHDYTGDLAVYNPGSTGRVVWFYALRDGLWYYVEVGKFG